MNLKAQILLNFACLYALLAYVQASEKKAGLTPSPNSMRAFGNAQGMPRSRSGGSVARLQRSRSESTLAMLQRQMSTASVSESYKPSALPGERTLYWGNLFEKLSHPDMLIGVTPTEKARGDMGDRMLASREKLVVVLVGLPARGKSYISHRLVNYLSWIGIQCRLFNVGAYRRQKQLSTGQKEDKGSRAEFFSAGNKEAAQKREELAVAVLDQLLAWLHEGGEIAIFDATNTSKNRRKMLLERVQQESGVEVLFVESICTDHKILETNLAEKVRLSPDFRGMDLHTAMRDLKTRIANYEAIYETLDETEVDTQQNSISFIKVINLSSKIIANQVHGGVARGILTFLMNLHNVPRPIFLLRAPDPDGLCEDDCNPLHHAPQTISSYMPQAQFRPPAGESAVPAAPAVAATAAAPVPVAGAEVGETGGKLPSRVSAGELVVDCVNSPLRRRSSGDVRDPDTPIAPAPPQPAAAPPPPPRPVSTAPLAASTSANKFGSGASMSTFVRSASRSPVGPQPTGPVETSVSAVEFQGERCAGLELAGEVSLPLRRAGDPTVRAVVHYQTVDGSASAGVDYTHVSGVLTLEPGQMVTDIRVRILPRPVVPKAPLASQRPSEASLADASA
eukprot:CAMPEP_0113686580 /NCGR_PEP_ID=MMETSP0038_2-20120614/15377_1 /TAXON_ID=2898 /ORGANISM="Cryptomonas paramecium" /LENGTH=621 /DNA_ID=CAMNT_0000606935 /DNA_START=151 /DNA_END=2013 /DNA_ORIENTATION=- /assembly_acc=CAM_ASM_000170